MSRFRTVVSIFLTAILALGLTTAAFAAPKLLESDAKEHFKLLNKEREAAGGETLQWDDDLAASAQIRAAELTQKYTTNHTRPDGSTYFSVSTKIWGENTAFGYKTAAEAMAAFKASKGHWKNIMDDRFTVVGVACSQGDDGTMYWVQHFGTGKTNASWAGVKEYDLDPFNDPNVKLKKTAAKTADLVDADGKVTTAANTELKKALAAATGSKVTLQIKNAKTISAATLQGMAKTANAAGKAAVLRADTLTASGKSVQGRLYLEPAKLANRRGDIKLGVFVDSKSVAAMKTSMEKKYGNTMAYIHMEHQGSLTVRTKVAAKVNLDGLNSDSLRFYVLGKNGKPTRIEKPEYLVDKNNYLSFYTSTGGDIVITDSDLV